MSDSILIISPHTDDAELGCGGSIAKFVEAGKDVHLLALSTAEKSIVPILKVELITLELISKLGV